MTQNNETVHTMYIAPMTLRHVDDGELRREVRGAILTDCEGRPLGKYFEEITAQEYAAKFEGAPIAVVFMPTIVRTYEPNW